MATETFAKRIALTVVAACLVLLATTAAIGARRASTATAVRAYVVGETTDVPSHVYAGAETTLVIIGRAECPACQRATPAYAEAIRSLRGALPDLRSVLLTPTAHADAEQAFARRLGVSRHQPMELNTLRARTVPTVMLVDGHGVILFAEEGTPADAARLKEAIVQRIPSR